MTLEENIAAIVESCFSGFKEELQKIAVERIMEQIAVEFNVEGAQSTKTCKTCKWADVIKGHHCESCKNYSNYENKIYKSV